MWVVPVPWALWPWFPRQQSGAMIWQWILMLQLCWRGCWGVDACPFLGHLVICKEERYKIFDNRIAQENVEDLVAEHIGLCLPCPAGILQCSESTPSLLWNKWLHCRFSDGNFLPGRCFPSPVSLEQNPLCDPFSLPFSSHLLIEEVNDEWVNRLGLDKGSWEAWRKYLTDPQSLPSRHY